MKSPAKIAGLLILVVVSFLAGRWYDSSRASRPAPAGRKVLYWHDPMHPAYKSDKPGIAPDCGMQLEPVYESGDAAATGSGRLLPPGTVHISPDSQQLIGVRVAAVVKSSGARGVRILGRVAVDETRVYRINAAIDGWIRDISSVTVGSFVRKDEVLAAYYAPEFIGPQQAYLFAMSALDRFRASGKETPEQISLTNANIQSAADTLRNMGMSDTQLQQMLKDRQLTQRIEIRSPASAFVLARNVSPGQRFDKGTELYRLADLSHVWILADIFEGEGRYVQPQSVVRVTHAAQHRTFQARVSDVLPQFDPVSRVLKVRLEAGNPGFALRPDMFVDVEFPVNLPETLTVPSDAVVDTGLRKIVFIDRGNGYFEPRRVETGWRIGDRVEITKGLMEGERIVVSGNFLVDSESRLRFAAAGLPEDASTDPVCGMGVDPRKAGEKKTAYRGETYYFCSPGCRQKFEKAPDQYLKGAGVRDSETASEKREGAGQARQGGKPDDVGARTKSVRDLVCGMEIEIGPGTLKTEYQGRTYHFCAQACRDSFLNEPQKYLKDGPEDQENAGGSPAFLDFGLPTPSCLPGLPRATLHPSPVTEPLNGILDTR